MNKKELDKLINSLKIVTKRLTTISDIAKKQHIAIDNVIVPVDVVDADDLGPCDPGENLIDVLDTLQTIAIR